MKDKDRWKYFALLASFLPYLLFMFQNDFYPIFWLITSPFWTIMLIVSSINLYEMFREDSE